MNRILKWVKRGALYLGGVLALALLAIYAISEYRLRKRYDIRPAAVALRGDPATVERGRHIATIRGCGDCHAANYAGRVFLDAPGVAHLFASNLTPGKGGVGTTYTDADWVAAIRHGVGPDGKPLLFMPSHEFNPLSDEDLSALIAYLKSLPPVDNPPERSTVGPLGRALYLAGQVPLLPVELIDHDAPRPRVPAPGPTAEYGAYLATGCTGCHGMGFSGGKIPGTPPDFPIPSNITPDPETGIGKWTEQDFVRAMRTGKRPDGRELNPIMPWKALAEMSDDELRALYLYLHSLPAKPHGQR